MTDKVKKFELVVLRPLQLLLASFAIVFLLKGLWMGLGVFALGVFYAGVIGSKLHPMQSARDLANGPLKGPTALVEAALLDPSTKNALVDHACTRVGILIGLVVAALLWAVLGWHWYFSLLIAWPALLLSAALLKVSFKTV